MGSAYNVTRHERSGRQLRKKCANNHVTLIQDKHVTCTMDDNNNSNNGESGKKTWINTAIARGDGMGWGGMGWSEEMGHRDRGRSLGARKAESRSMGGGGEGGGCGGDQEVKQETKKKR